MKSLLRVFVPCCLLVCLVLSGCEGKAASSTIEEFKKDLEKEVAAATPQFEPSKYIAYGDGAWHFACLMSNGKEFLLSTNQKFGGSAKTVIWASYDKKQKFAIKGYEEHPYFTKDEPNKGAEAKISYVLANIDQVGWKMESDGVDAKAIDAFLNTGAYYYRISIDAFDKGWHASYVVTQTDPANYALIKSVLDDQLASRATLHYPATKSTGDTAEDCVAKTKIIAVDIEKKPLENVEFIYKTENKNSRETSPDATIAFDVDQLPTRVVAKKTINGAEATAIVNDLKPKETYTVILANEQQRIEKYKSDLQRYGEILWGSNFSFEDTFNIEMNDKGITQFETNPFMWKNGLVRFDKTTLVAGDVDTPYHEGFHALWECTSIDDAAGTRENVWKPLPNLPENAKVKPENFAMDEAQAHMAGFRATQYYYDDTELDDSEYTIENAKKAVKNSNVSGNEIEGVVATFLLQLYRDDTFEDALRDMKAVKDDYYDLYGKYPQTIREFAAEKLKMSDEKTRARMLDLANDLSIDVGLAAGPAGPGGTAASSQASPSGHAEQSNNQTSQSEENWENQPIEDRGTVEVTPG